MESATLPCGGGERAELVSGGLRRSRELCEALELVPATLQAGHFRPLSSNHSRPPAATIKTTMMLHGVDGGVVVGVVEGNFCGVGGCTTGDGFGVGVVSVEAASAVPIFGFEAARASIDFTSIT